MKNVVNGGSDLYEDLEIEFGDQKNYQVIKKLGRGKYSEVFLGMDMRESEKVVIKVLKPVRMKKIKREMMILTDLRGGPNILQLKDVVVEKRSGVISLITEYVKGMNLRDIMGNTTLDGIGIKKYLYGLLKAIHFSHQKGIFHRDIKPSNVIIEGKKRIRLIDWGLAEYFNKEKEYNCRVASRYYKSPEILCGLKKYGLGLDIWSFGCTLAEMCFDRSPFFPGRDNNDQLVRIARRLGTPDLYKFLEKYKLELPSHFDGLLSPSRFKRKDLSKHVNEKNSSKATLDAIDLLEKIFVYDPEDRATSDQILKHPFFQDMRNLEYM